MTFLVVEPTIKSASVYEQYTEYAREYDVTIRVIGNKITDEDDRSFIQERVGNALVGTFAHSRFVKATEKGNMLPLEELESENMEALKRMKEGADRQKKTGVNSMPKRYSSKKKNAESWANVSTGTDVTQQIDPSFSLADAVRRM